MSKMKTLQVTVVGLGEFPLDMLRHDHLCFLTEEDSSKAAHIGPESRSIRLIGWLHGIDEGPSRVTPERWRSFCWRVESISIDYKSQRVYDLQGDPKEKKILYSKQNSDISPELVSEFRDLENRMSSENLTNDGELSGVEIEARYRQILTQFLTQWAVLERKAGRQVTLKEISRP